jgi:hypothetical protein
MERSHPLFLSENTKISALKTLLALPNVPVDVEIGLHRPWLQAYLAVKHVVHLFFALNRHHHL